MTIVALIPARAGSRRIPGKNTKLLGGHPLIAYTIAAAHESGIFATVCVCADEYEVCLYATQADCAAVLREPVSDHQPDIEWVREAIGLLEERPDAFAILRPTSPFRTAETIRRCYQEFREMADCGDSLRAVEPVKQTPYKMWTWLGPGYPITPFSDRKHPDGTPYHSSPTQSLPTVYIQNSSLEMAWTANVEVHGTIHGRKVGPFFTDGHEGFSIDYPEDWEQAERLLAAGVPHADPRPLGLSRQVPPCTPLADAAGCP